MWRKAVPGCKSWIPLYDGIVKENQPRTAARCRRQESSQSVVLKYEEKCDEKITVSLWWAKPRRTVERLDDRGRALEVLFCFLRLEIVYLSNKNANQIKKRTISNICPCHLTLLLILSLLYPHQKCLFFYMGFHTNWLRVCLLWGQLGPRAYIYSEGFPNKYINNCACSMHRNDLHDGMFWSEILHDLS